jgi:hypothetical protein
VTEMRKVLKLQANFKEEIENLKNKKFVLFCIHFQSQSLSENCEISAKVKKNVQ